MERPQTEPFAPLSGHPAAVAARARFAGLVRCFAPASAPWLALWLPSQVAEEVDTAMLTSPSLGLALDHAAQQTLMSRLRRFAPGVAQNGCAPLPAPHAGADAELAAAGLARTAGGGLPLRYSVLTWSPASPKQGCASCMLQKGCPHLNQAGTVE